MRILPVISINLTAGRYNLKIEIQLSSSVTCQYNNPNIEIKNEVTTLRAYAGVAEDIYRAIPTRLLNSTR